MSKYRIAIGSSSIHLGFEVGFGILMLFSVLCWKPGGIAVTTIQVVLSFAICWLTFWRIKQIPGDQSVLNLDEQGRCVIAGENWQVSSDSRATSLVVWLKLAPALGGKPQCLTIFRDQVKERDYRRLCRLAYLVQFRPR